MNFDLVDLVDGALVALVAEAPSGTFPDRQFVWAGNVVFDCESLVAHGVQVTQTIPGQSAPLDKVRQWTAWSLEFGFTVVRCVPTDPNGFPLDPTESTNVGGVALSDAGALLRYTTSALLGGRLLGACEAATIGPVQWGGPNGGMIGTTLRVTAQIG